MVFGNPFRCDMCDTVIKLKIQADNSLFNYDYPISVVCPKCGNQIELTYNRGQGILPSEYKVDVNTKADCELYYSALLPIVECLYMKPSEQLALTPYLELSKYYSPIDIAAQNFRGNLFFNNIYPFRRTFAELLPIYRKENVLAFSKKLAKLYHVGNEYTPIANIKQCRKILFEFLQSTYNNLAPKEYVDNVANPFLIETIDVLHLEVLQDAYKSATNIVNYERWQEKAFDFVAEMVAKFEKYLPSLFYCTVGDFRDRHDPPTNTYTISMKEVVEDYDTSFNLIKDLLPLIVSLANFKITGKITKFPNGDSGMKGISTIVDFYKLPDGLKLDKLQDYPEIISYLCGGFNNKIRNGIGHRRWSQVPESQIIQFRYKQNEENEHFDIRLIVLGSLVIVNFLHIIEFLLLIEKLKN